MITEADIIPYMPHALIVEATDDAGLNTGEINGSILEKITAAAERRAAGCFGGRIPQIAEGEAREAAIIFTCEILHTRRGYAEGQNPFAALARGWEKRLRAIADGEAGVSDGSVGVVTEPSLTAAGGRQLV